jgi:hypothetical protein
MRGRRSKAGTSMVVCESISEGRLKAAPTYEGGPYVQRRRSISDTEWSHERTAACEKTRICSGIERHAN